MQNARNQTKPLVEKYDKPTSVEDDLGQTKLQDIQNISVEHLSYEINDVSLNDVSSASLYEKIGVAFQEPYLFGFSLKENHRSICLMR